MSSPAANPAEFVVDFPTLFVSVDWVEAHCVVPDGQDRGKPFLYSDWQAWCLLNHQRVKPTAQPGELGPAFHYRRSQLVLPQKTGKSPWDASWICLEAVGPALFAGWAKGGERYDCREHGCDCGWVYEYRPGEPMGKPWATPLIQITANSEDQTGNIYDALRPMIDKGPLAQLIPKTGEELIRLPGGGEIATVTSNARSRLGQRVTAVAHDESGLYTDQNGMVKVAATQRRGLAGMGGRSIESTNGWDPNENSTAQRTAERALQVGDIFRYHPQAPAHLSYRNKAERKKIHRHVYRGSPWVPLESIEAEAAELMLDDPAQAERFFGNRVVSGKGNAFDRDKFEALTRDPSIPAGIEKGRDVTAGYDPSINHDTTGILVIDVETGHHIVLASWTRPLDLKPEEDWHVPMNEVDQAVEFMFDHWNVLRFNCDPEPTQVAIAGWAGRWQRVKIAGRMHEIVVNWWTNRDKAVGLAVKAWRTAMEQGDFTHGPAGDDVPIFGDEITHEQRHQLLIEHVGNAVRKSTNIKDETDGKFLSLIRKINPSSVAKIDLAMCGILAWDARIKVIALGALKPKRHGRTSFR